MSDLQRSKESYRSVDDDERVVPFGFWVVLALLFGVPAWVLVFEVILGV